MSFASVMEHYRQLRQELVRHGGDAALPAIEGLSLPTGEDDELSFIRLVVWSYALLQENGRVSLRFLRELGKMPRDPLQERVISLRAWLTHNLSLSSDSDRRRMNAARTWMQASCGHHLQLKAEDWKGCFGALCGALCETLQGAIASCAILDDPMDGPHNVEELRRRLEKNWDAYMFDAYVRDSASLLGLDDIDIVSFRTRHLAEWRRVVEVAEDGNSRRLLAQRIEADLLRWFGDALPLTAAEVLRRVAVSTMELSTLMLVVRARVPVTRSQLVSALEGLATNLDAAVGAAKPPTDDGAVVGAPR